MHRTWKYAVAVSALGLLASLALVGGTPCTQCQHQAREVKRACISGGGSVAECNAAGLAFLCQCLAGNSCSTVCGF